jgi:hypothetical protein
MVRGIIIPLALLFGLTAAHALGERSDEQTAEATTEAQVLRAISAGSLEQLQAVAKDVRSRKPAERTQLPLRIRSNSVELSFQGVFPGERFSPERFEYLLSDARHDYESLLVVDAKELARLKKIGQALEALKKAGKQAALDYKIAWVEEGKARVENVEDILGLLDSTKRTDFLSQLAFGEFGLGGKLNVQADTAMLPARRTPATLLLTIRVPSP